MKWGLDSMTKKIMKTIVVIYASSFWGIRSNGWLYGEWNCWN